MPDLTVNDFDLELLRADSDYPATFREFLLMHMDADTLRTIANHNASGGGHCLTTDEEIYAVYDQYRDELFDLAHSTWVGYRNPDWSAKNRNLLPVSESCQAARYIRSVSRWSYDRSAELNDWMVMVPADNASCPSRFESWLVWLCAEVIANQVVYLDLAVDFDAPIAD